MAAVAQKNVAKRPSESSFRITTKDVPRPASLSRIVPPAPVVVPALHTPLPDPELVRLRTRIEGLRTTPSYGTLRVSTPAEAVAPVVATVDRAAPVSTLRAIGDVVQELATRAKASRQRTGRVVWFFRNMDAPVDGETRREKWYIMDDHVSAYKVVMEHKSSTRRTIPFTEFATELEHADPCYFVHFAFYMAVMSQLPYPTKIVVEEEVVQVRPSGLLEKAIGTPQIRLRHLYMLATWINMEALTTPRGRHLRNHLKLAASPRSPRLARSTGPVKTGTSSDDDDDDGEEDDVISTASSDYTGDSDTDDVVLPASSFS